MATFFQWIDFSLDRVFPQGDLFSAGRLFIDFPVPKNPVVQLKSHIFIHHKKSTQIQSIQIKYFKQIESTFRLI